MPLQGSERKILNVIFSKNLSDSDVYVADSLIAHTAQLPIDEVRDCLESLEEKECVQRSYGVAGFSAYITAKGRQELRRSSVRKGEALVGTISPLKVVPKGLRSYNQHDAEFF